MMHRTFTQLGLAVVLAVGSGWMEPDAGRRPTAHGPRAPDHFVLFSGQGSYVEVPAAAELGVTPAGLTVAVWMRPGALSFPKTEGSRPTEQYVHWLGKGEAGKHEWTFRMYSQTTPSGPRANRISFYVFNLNGGRGCGSYFQDAIVPGQWIHVVGVVNPTTHRTAIYKNGALRHEDNYAGIIEPGVGTAPLRIGTKDLSSFFVGAIGPLQVWNRALTAEEIRSFYTSQAVPGDGLVASYAITEKGGAVLHDAQGRHDGTIHDATWGQGGGPIAEGGPTQSGGGC
jgi:hypothetical protein